jgi:hypothetical protein
MSVNGISPPSANSYDSPFAGRRQKLEALRDAIDSGDLQAAQSAFASLNLPQGTDVSPAGPGGPQGKNQFGSDLQAIGQALGAGDIDAAKQALAMMRQHRHHGAHHHSATTTDTTAANPPEINATGDSVGTSLNVIA